MTKDYNKDGGGKHAEQLYAAHSVAKIIADIPVGNEQPSNARESMTCQLVLGTCS